MGLSCLKIAYMFPVLLPFSISISLLYWNGSTNCRGMDEPYLEYGSKHDIRLRYFSGMGVVEVRSGDLVTVWLRTERWKGV